MKAFLFAAFGGLALFSAGMIATRPPEGKTGKVVLTWVTDKNPLRDAQIALFERQYPNVQVVIDPGNMDAQKVIVQSQAGVGPDVFDYWGQANFDAYRKSGIAAPLNDALKARGVDMKATVWPIVLPWTVGPKGEIYAVPANVGLDAFWFHKDMFDAAGVPYPKAPWTTDDLVATAKRLTKRDASGAVVQYGLLIDFAAGYREYLPSFGGQLYSPDGKRCTVDSPESVACLEWVRSLIYVHRVSPSPNDEQAMATGGAWGGTGPQGYFRKRMGAMAMGGRWWLAQLRTDIKERGFRLGAVAPPVARYPRFGNGGTRAVMMNASSPHPKEAADFLAYLLKSGYNTLLNDQGDALAGVRDSAYTPRYEANPMDPGADFHRAFRDALETAVPLPNSPYVAAPDADGAINRQLDLVKLDQKSPKAAMRDAAREVNALIQRSVARDAELKAQWDAAGNNAGVPAK